MNTPNGHTATPKEINPLSGIRVPSIASLVEDVMDRLGQGLFDLSNPLQRRRLRSFLEHALGLALNRELERALSSATEKAVEHVFRLMRDADYQEKKAKRLKESREAANERRKERDRIVREARMDYSRKQLKVDKETVQ